MFLPLWFKYVWTGPQTHGFECLVIRGWCYLTGMRSCEAGEESLSLEVVCEVSNAQQAQFLFFPFIQVRSLLKPPVPWDKGPNSWSYLIVIIPQMSDFYKTIVRLQIYPLK